VTHSQVQTKNYRKDIDGIRAIAVLSVILFHLGYLPNGYLGVDIFFVISGYLITKIVYNEAIGNKFSIFDFYLRRIRRIIPLVLFTSLVALIIGLFVMLPDDLENLSQSVFATNFFLNNILLLITSGDYWSIANKYKPLMHTWSLGVEEQFYLIAPLTFLFLNGKRGKWILPLLIILTIISFSLFILSSDEHSKFYLIQFRFFELSLGGLAAIIFNNRLISSRYKLILIPIILVILSFDINLSGSVKLILITLASACLLISNKNKFCELVLENKLMISIGKISFSLYMWHQIIIAYTRYFVTENITITNSIVTLLLILLLSMLSYYFIEQPFRDRKRVKTKTLLIVTGFLFILVTGCSFLLYTKAGIIRDVPELEIYRSASHNKVNLGSAKRNVHIEYNAIFFDLDKNFIGDQKIKVLIIGNSFARDWANVLLESKYGNKIEISYTPNINNCKDISERLSKAKYIFFSELEMQELHTFRNKFNIDFTKVWNVGTKNFGSNNGIFYNKRGSKNYCHQRVYINPAFLKTNDDLQNQWHDKYINLIEMIVDEKGAIPVFTPDCKFISQDCLHLTHAGAVYFARLINNNNSFKLE
jgi:peptidoglycan/LPS O-acetylase OafA/YrhL